MIKNLQTTITGGNGYTYLWSVTSSSCSTPITDTVLGYGLENGIGGNGTIHSNTATLKLIVTIHPDECPALTIMLEVFNLDGEKCNQISFDLVTNISSPNYNWRCNVDNDTYGCQQYAGLPSNENEFETEEDCLACATCPCNTVNTPEPCACVVDAVYDCVTDTFTIYNNSSYDDEECHNIYIGEVFINIVGFNNNASIYSGGHLTIGNNIPITDIDLPNGTYYTSFSFFGGTSCNFTKQFLVDCETGETNNIFCCNQIANGNSHNIGNVGGIDGYILDIGAITGSLHIDFGYNTISDQIAVYKGVQNINSLVALDLIARTPPCGDLASCHNTEDCVSNLFGDVISGFWTGSGVYDVGGNPGIGGQNQAVRDALTPAWSSELAGVTTPTVNAGSGGILVGQGRLTIPYSLYHNVDNKLTIVVYNNNSACPYDGEGCNNQTNNTAYKFVVVCPTCETPELGLICGQEATSEDEGVNITPGEYTEYNFDISDKVCGTEPYLYFAIDYDMGTAVDRIKVFYKNALLDDVVIGATPHVGTTCLKKGSSPSDVLTLCDGTGDTSNELTQCYVNGFYQNDTIQQGTTVGSIPVLVPVYSITPSSITGAGRLTIVGVPYITGENNVVIKVFNNYNIDGNCVLSWTIKPVCLECCEDVNGGINDFINVCID